MGAEETLQATVDALKAQVEKNEKAMDTFYLLFAASLVFLMQAGFALLAAGSIRMKSVKNILLKSVMDACAGGIIWYLFGFGVAFHQGEGGNGFIGTSGFNYALSGVDDTSGASYGAEWAFFFFQYAFAAAAATITSGAVAERCTLTGYLAYVMLIVGLLYPVVVHWVWDPNGFLSAFNPEPPGPFKKLPGMIDFAGSGVVHLTGGVCAFMGALTIRPRLGRFVGDETLFAGQSSSLQVLGTFLLWFGWYGFNPGSTLAITPAGYARDAARAAVTTTLAAASGATTGLLLKRGLPSQLGGVPMWDLAATCNSLLGGLVSITAGCSTVDVWASIVIGLVGAIVYHVASCTMRKLKIDDPLDAFAVHGACGLWGCIAVGLFCTEEYSYSPHADSTLYAKRGKVDCGIFYGGSGLLLATQIVGPIFIILWAGGLSLALFGSLKALGLLRISVEVEQKGLDSSKHGGSAYPNVDAALKSLEEWSSSAPPSPERFGKVGSKV